MTDENPHDVLRADRDFVHLVERHGELTLSPHEDPFTRMVVSILRQQVSMDAAAAIRERLFDALVDATTNSDGEAPALDAVTVTPADVLAAEEATLRDAGLSAAKVEYVRALATAWSEQGYTRAHFAELDDDAVRSELIDVRGVGDWTANMFLMFGLGRADVFPVGDLGIRQGMERHFGIEERPAMVERAEQWRPYRSYASLYLWQDGD